MKSNNEQFENYTNNLLQAATDMNSLVRDSVNASLQSVSIVTKGCSDLCDSCSAMVQKYLDQSIKISQTLLSSNSVNEFVDTQNSVIKSSFDSLVSDMSNITQLSQRIAQEAAEPVANQINSSIAKVSKKVA
ncbi:MAG: phasin family protein [Proteobacteria bacterium]|jgi:phasin family protein|nr:phasin family protein [Alphaproteobacteria bacterium]NCC03693.1 phasin family protein [Pseudomonadota bacterium]